ncbi:MAG: thioredoxin family protein [Bacteroidota bacterium]
MELKHILNLIATTPALMLYFFNDSCAPCKILRPKVQSLVESEFPKLEFLLVNTEQNAETSACFGIFSSPVILVFFEGKEYIRENKNIAVSELHDKIERLYNMAF